MKNLTLLLTVLLCLNLSAQSFNPDPITDDDIGWMFLRHDFIPLDKQAHFTLSGAAAFGTYGFFKHVTKSKTGGFLGSVGFATSLNLIKEWQDPVFDKNDLATGFIGAVFGALVYHVWHLLHEKHMKKLGFFELKIGI